MYLVMVVFFFLFMTTTAVTLHSDSSFSRVRLIACLVIILGEASSNFQPYLTENLPFFRSVPSGFTASNMYPCDLCGKLFTRRNALATHIAKHDSYKGPRNCKCLECDMAFIKIRDLRQHLNSMHDIKQELHLLEFPSEKEFLQWKVKEEIRTNTQFIMRSFNKRTKGAKQYFNCNRSGIHRENISYKDKGRQRKTKLNGSDKIGFSCTAQILVKRTEQDTYKVTFYPTHYGHEIDIKHIRLKRYLKDCIASNLFSDNDMDSSTLPLDVIKKKSKEEIPIILQSAINETSKSREMKQLRKEIKTDIDSIMKEIELLNLTDSQEEDSIENMRRFQKYAKVFNIEIKKYNQTESDIQKKKMIECSQNDSGGEKIIENIEQPIYSNLTSVQSEDIEYIVINFENDYDTAHSTQFVTV